MTLLTLALELLKVRNAIVKSALGIGAAQCSFGPYLQNVLAVYHLLTGIAKKNVEVLFLRQELCLCSEQSK